MAACRCSRGGKRTETAGDPGTDCCLLARWLRKSQSGGGRAVSRQRRVVGIGGIRGSAGRDRDPRQLPRVRRGTACRARGTSSLSALRLPYHSVRPFPCSARCRPVPACSGRSAAEPRAQSRQHRRASAPQLREGSRQPVLRVASSWHRKWSPAPFPASQGGLSWLQRHRSRAGGIERAPTAGGRLNAGPPSSCPPTVEADLVGITQG